MSRKLIISVVLTLVVVITLIFLSWEEKEVNIDTNENLTHSSLEEDVVPDGGLRFEKPASWSSLVAEISNQKGTEEEYRNSVFSGMRPEYSQIIPYTTYYSATLPNCPVDDADCSVYVDISLIEYSDRSPYLMGCRAECEVFDLRAEEKWNNSKTPTFTSNGIAWVCGYDPEGGGWTLAFSCRAYEQGKSVRATLNYSLNLERHGVLKPIIEGTFSFADFATLTKKQDQYQVAEADFLKFVKTIKLITPNSNTALQTTASTNQVSIPMSNPVQDTQIEAPSIVEDAIRQPAYLMAVHTKDGNNYLEVDYVEWLKGEDAGKAMREDGQCTSGGDSDCYEYPNGYKRNLNNQIRTLIVSPNATINVSGYMSDLNGQGTNVSIPFNKFKGIFSEVGSTPVFITIDIKNNVVTKIAEPYQE